MLSPERHSLAFRVAMLLLTLLPIVLLSHFLAIIVDFGTETRFRPFSSSSPSLSTGSPLGGVRTNVLQGTVHILLFIVYVALIFSP
jgi:Ca2+/H+ antiporter